MKVLWLGDGGCHTGFGRVTHAIGDRLASDYGHDISVLAINYRGDYWPTPMKLYVPTMRNGRDIYGLSRVVEMLDIVEPDVVVILNDPQVVMRYLFSNKWDEEKMLLGMAPLLVYLPIDGYNQPPAWDVLANTTKRVAMSRHGQRHLPGSKLVYHGIDSAMYRPVEESPITVSNGQTLRTKAECKRAFGFDPEGFLVLRVDRNSYRKNYPDTIKALWPFLDAHPDVQVHLHCEQRDESGFNISAMLNRHSEHKIRFFFPEQMDTFQGWPEPDLAALYNAADVFVSTSWGEGFGLTIGEAVSTGIPVIAQNVSATPEVVGPGGILLEPERETTVPSGQDQWLPNVSAFTDALETLYADSALRASLGAQGREHVQRSFSWDVAARRFHDFIVELGSSDPQAGVTDGNEVQHLLGSAEGVRV